MENPQSFAKEEINASEADHTEPLISNKFLEEIEKLSMQEQFKEFVQQSNTLFTEVFGEIQKIESDELAILEYLKADLENRQLIGKSLETEIDRIKMHIQQFLAALTTKLTI